jgi:formylglycine-generating enzyme required for sulfatase activity
MLRKGHQGVRLSREAWDRLGTWIDLNGPCHGSWDGAFPVPDGARERRTALRRAFGGPVAGPEEAAAGQSLAMTGVLPPSLPKPGTVGVSGWPFSAEEARRRQAAAGGRPERMLDLGGGVAMRLMRIPAGEFVMGDPHGEPDELPVVRVRIGRPFWLGALEVTNGQYRQYDPGHDSRYYVKRHARGDDQGLTLSAADQPVVRVSWDQAMAFCGWLSRKTGARCSLPTEAQWEWACRAGSAAPWSYGGPEADFSAHGNLADLAFSRGFLKDGTQRTGGLEHLVLEGAALADRRFDDRAIVTAAAGSYRPNVWGLFDMHGNAAEWTRTIYRPDPSADDPRDDPAANGLRAVRGGSFFDPSRRCRSAFRLGYPPWQRLFNVGFRVVCED